jgi:hypothetical protein
MLPSAAFHVTDLLEVVPTTLAVKGIVPPVTEEAEEGETATEVTAGPVGAGVLAAVIVTVAVADSAESALLVATMRAVPALAGAV